MAARDYLLLRLEAPLMSFGGPMVDQIGRTRLFPGQAQITGLLGNALGYAHGEADALESLQARLHFAAALVDPGEQLRDYHTVDLGRRHLTGTGWTTRESPESRAGASGDTTHIRYRWYLADALLVVALTLDPPEDSPCLSDLADALDHPARPLFIGRKSCLPTAPLRLGAIVTSATVIAALQTGLARVGSDMRQARIDPTPRTEIDAKLVDGPPSRDTTTDRLVDRRDWRNQMHTGTRLVHRFPLPQAAERAP